MSGDKKDREQPSPEQEQPPGKTVLSRFNKHIWGVDHPSRGHKVAITLLGVFLALGLYGTYTKGFFPSEQWMDLAVPAVWILTISFSATYYWAFSKGKIKFKEGQKKIPPLILLGCIPLFLYFIFWAAIPIGAGRAYTVLYGTYEEKTITVSKNERSKSAKKCLQSKELGTGFLRDFCIKEHHYTLIKSGDRMIVYGKVSWFGMVIVVYTIHDKDLTDFQRQK